MRLALKIIGGYVVAAILLYTIGHNRTPSAWFLGSFRVGVAILVCLVVGTVVWFCAPAVWTWVRHPTFPKPKTIFTVIAVGLLIWMLLAPGGFLTCRPTATGNMIVDYLCEPLYDSTYPKESEEAIKTFWAGSPNAKS